MIILYLKVIFTPKHVLTSKNNIEKCLCVVVTLFSNCFMFCSFSFSCKLTLSNFLQTLHVSNETWCISLIRIIDLNHKQHSFLSSVNDVFHPYIRDGGLVNPQLTLLSSIVQIVKMHMYSLPSVLLAVHLYFLDFTFKLVEQPLSIPGTFILPCLILSLLYSLKMKEWKTTLNFRNIQLFRTVLTILKQTTKHAKFWLRVLFPHKEFLLSHKELCSIDLIMCICRFFLLICRLVYSYA